MERVDEFGLIDERNKFDELAGIVGLMMFEGFDSVASLLDVVEERVIEIVACMVFLAVRILGKDASLHQSHSSHILGMYYQYSFYELDFPF